MIPSLHPTVFVIFGATGDVVAKKVLPALYHLFCIDALPPAFRILGFSRRESTTQDFQSYVSDLMVARGVAKEDSRLQAFLTLFFYEQGRLDVTEDYQRLVAALEKVDAQLNARTNRLLYLGVPPNLYEPIMSCLGQSGLVRSAGIEESWTRILVEKPIGTSAETSRHVDELLTSLFEEHQIYRIEHYLAKEMLRTILPFRFSNQLFEKMWNRDGIERVEIRLWETLNVENRGAFYDGVGALRDVGQNHLLQMLALVAMDAPMDFSAASVRTKREEILESLHLFAPEEIEASTYRAQHVGYQAIKGVAPDSTTETYVKIRASLDHPRWRGVSFILEAGKCLHEQRKEIVVTFKNSGGKNRIIFSLEPEEGIRVDFQAKKPGYAMELETRALEFSLRGQAQRSQYVEEYEQVITHAIRGDQSLFVSAKELRAMWRFVDPILTAWKQESRSLHTYVPQTDQAIQESKAMGVFSLKQNEIGRAIGMIGLGKMGANLARRSRECGWRVVGYNRTPEAVRALESEGIEAADSLADLVRALPTPRIIWLMVPAGGVVDEMLATLVPLLSAGDTVIDGGNSLYRDAARRAQLLEERGIAFMDVGTSGGPGGARRGPCLMIGGTRTDFERLEGLFRDIALPGGFKFFEGHGAGHFVKMVHNGIEYGMMQAIAEGFAVLKKSDYQFDLTDVVDIYSHGSVIESRLVSWLKGAFELHGEELTGVSGTVAHTGEGAWTVQAAHELEVEVPIIEGSFQFRVDSEKQPSYIGKILSALREQFGGHSVGGKEEKKK